MIQIIKSLTLVFVLFSVASCAVFTEVSSSTSSTVDTVTPDVTLNSFVEQRYVAIRQDAANGGGENLDALAHLLGEEDSHAFAKFMQTDFDRIFTDIDQPVDILARINAGLLNQDS